MDVTIVGSVALDTVETPWGRNNEGLGGAATYFSLAAVELAPVHLVGVVGDDFPQQHVSLLANKGINLDGLERQAGKTFRWTGRYHEDVNLRDTLETQLNVFETFHPKLPDAARQSPFLFLGNIHPALQLEVLSQTDAKFIGLDTMNLWIEIARDDLDEVLRHVNALVINDSEVRLLTGDINVVAGAKRILEMGPEIVVVKKGEHGCLLFAGDDVFAAPALPMASVLDPTGAGDSFAGGFLGYLARVGETSFDALRRACIYGSAVASFTCEAFGPDRLAAISLGEIEGRVNLFKALTYFE